MMSAVTTESNSNESGAYYEYLISICIFRTMTLVWHILVFGNGTAIVHVLQYVHLQGKSPSFQ